MNIKELRLQLGITQNEFATRYNIPFRTIQNWETGARTPSDYIISLLRSRVEEDLVNHKTFALPTYDPTKKNLPKRSDYIGARAWLAAVKECLGDVVFALDEALMCEGLFLGRSDEYIVWVYGDNSVLEYNGVVVLGNSINKQNIKEKNGLLFTNFNRTLTDSFANEDILDMQGITEALSRYYSENNDSFDGIFVIPKYQNRFDDLVVDAIDYYTY